MRAKEFVINIPINIKLNGDGDPEVSVAGEEPGEEEKQDVFMSPLQQEVELQKQQGGKDSEVIDQIVDDDDEERYDDDDYQGLMR